MSFKRFMALALSLTLLLCALPQLTVVSYAQTATTSGCPYSTDGRHSWGQWETDVPGTCVTKERLVRKCKLCGALDYWTKDYGDHDWGEWETVKAPTATEPGEEKRVCKNSPNHVETREIPATGEDDGPHPKLTYTVSWADDVGEGKRYVGATLEMHYKTINSGDCPVRITFVDYCKDVVGPSGAISAPCVIELQPGEFTSCRIDNEVSQFNVDRGKFSRTSGASGIYVDADGEEKKVYSNTVDIDIPLTYPEGEEPEEAKPGLMLVWKYDEIWHNGNHIETCEPGILTPDESVSTCFDYYNTGNVPLKLYSYLRFAYNSKDNHWSTKNLPLLPGESDFHSVITTDLIGVITTGTETKELLGTITLTLWAVGRDPETGEELCKSNEITRTWKVGREKDWEIPEGSKLSAALMVKPGYESSDPAGYQLGEDYAAVLYVKNTGLVDLDGYTVEDPWDGSTFSGGPIAVGEEQSFPRASGTVTEKDVSDGSIKLPMITVSWEDPDSEETRTAFAGPLNLTVISKTGLLVKKSVANNPANGSYFTAGETIKWKLTVTNNSKEPIKNVSVTDKGKNVGSFSEIAPGETKTCAVPDHTVTEYDEAVGYVTNAAVAKGTDVKDVTRTYPSNTAKAWTAEPEDEKEEKYKDKEKDDEDPGKKHIDLDKLKTGDGDEDKKTGGDDDRKTGDDDKKTGGDDDGKKTGGDDGKKTGDDDSKKTGDDDGKKTDDGDEDKQTEGAGDYCSLTLERMSATEASYTLHACTEHIGTAKEAEALGIEGEWAAAAELWRAEVDEIYELLSGVSDEEGLEILTADREALYAYADAVQALFGDEEAANFLRLRCAELCCMIHTAPDDLPSSLAGGWAMFDRAETYEVSSREIGSLAGSDSKVIDHYAADAAEALANTKALLNASRSYNWDEAFHQSMSYWQGALDGQVNEIYMAAAKEQKKLIATWRKSLDALRKADRNFCEIIYEENPAAVEELLMDLYKDAVVFAGIIK